MTTLPHHRTLLYRYAASDNFTRVFDNSGTQLHRLEQDFAVNSVALSHKHNLLVCVGYRGIAQLWDTASHQPLGQSFHQHEMDLCCASFSPDGRYLVYGGYDHKMSLWVVKDIAPDIAVRPFTSILQVQSSNTKQEIQSKSASPSLKVSALIFGCLYLTGPSQGDATNRHARSGDDGKDVGDDYYGNDNFFRVNLCFIVQSVHIDDKCS
jgi:WD40 repeat protein